MEENTPERIGFYIAMLAVVALSIFSPKQAHAQEAKGNGDGQGRKDSTEQAIPVNQASVVHQNTFLGAYYWTWQAFFDAGANSQNAGFSARFGPADRKGIGVAAIAQLATSHDGMPAYRFNLATGAFGPSTYSNDPAARSFGAVEVPVEISNGSCNIGGFVSFGGSYLGVSTFSLMIGMTPYDSVVYGVGFDVAIGNAVLSVGTDGSCNKNVAPSLRLGLETKVAENFRLGASYIGPEPPGWFSKGPGVMRGVVVSTGLKLTRNLELGLNVGTNCAGIALSNGR